MRLGRIAVLLVAAVGLLPGVVGCGGGHPVPRPVGLTAPRDPLEHFQSTNRHTVTPHGRIDVDSAVEKDGMIYYKTDDGKQWRVPYHRRAEGYSYGTPEEVR